MARVNFADNIDHYEYESMKREIVEIDSQINLLSKQTAIMEEGITSIKVANKLTHNLLNDELHSRQSDRSKVQFKIMDLLNEKKEIKIQMEKYRYTHRQIEI